MRRLAPDIFRKRLLIEGFYTRVEFTSLTLREYFAFITTQLGLRTYGDPIVHETSGQGKAANQGFDAFVPLIDSGIYVCVWTPPKFLSVILYTCAEFDEGRATDLTRQFFGLSEWETALF